MQHQATKIPSERSAIHNGIRSLLENDAVLVIIFGFVALLAYWQMFGLYWVQDDAFAFIAGHHLLAQFQHYEVLQYRPLSYVLGRILELLFGISPISLRIGSFAIHTLNCWLLFRFINRVIGNRLYSFLATLLFELHYAFYFIFGLYFVAAMPGLGVTAFLLTMACFQKALISRVRERAAGARWLVLGLICQFMGLLIYEGSVPVVACLVPIAILNTDSAYLRERQWRKIWSQLVQVIPYAVIAMAYLAIRIPLIKRALDEGPDKSHWYHPGIANIWGNFASMGKTVLGYPHYFNFNITRFYIYCGVVVLGVIYLSIRKPRVFFLGGTMCLVGALPFITLPALQEYYAIFPMLGVCLLFAGFLQALETTSRLGYLPPLAGSVFLCIFAHKSITMTNADYPRHELTAMANWALSFNQQFFPLAKHYPPGANIEVRGITVWQQWRIHFGNNTNIHYPLNAPFYFTFVTPDEVKRQEGQKTASTMSADKVVLQIINLDPDEKKGLFKVVELVAPKAQTGR